MGWVVRNGKSYITENISPLRDAENITSTFGAHYTGLFPSSISSKSMIGYDKNGKLMILQIDGVPSIENSGMNIFELADFAVELGFYSGINLISVVNMVQNCTTVSLNTENCLNLNGTDGAQYYKCPGAHKGTYACIRSVLTPSKRPISTPSSSHNSFQPTTSFSTSSSQPNSSPSSASYKHPTRYPTRAHHPYREPGSDSGNYPKPSYSKPSNNYANNDDFENGNKPDSNNDSTGLNGLNGNATLLSSYQTLKTSMNFYKESSEILFLLLVVSVVMNVVILAKTRKENKNNQSLVLDGYGKLFYFIACFLLIYTFTPFLSLFLFHNTYLFFILFQFLVFLLLSHFIAFLPDILLSTILMYMYVRALTLTYPYLQRINRSIEEGDIQMYGYSTYKHRILVLEIPKLIMNQMMNLIQKVKFCF